MINGKQIPTAPSAAVPTCGIRAMYTRSTMLYSRFNSWAASIGRAAPRMFPVTVPFSKSILFIFSASRLLTLYLFCAIAASTTCSSRMEVVTPPTPRGTGVIASTIFSASSKFTSPQSFPSSFTLIPTSMTICPSLR